MAWNNTYRQRLLAIIKDKNNAKKIIPFIKSRHFWYKKKILENFKIDSLSKPYPGHDKLLEHVKNRNGFFVVCGGNDGYFQDPTYYLEKFRGWNGIIVEPLDIAGLCKINRPKSKVYKYAVVSPDYKEKTVKMIDVNAMSFVEGSLDNAKEWTESGERTQSINAKTTIAEARTIQSILDEYGKNIQIDLFVADIEGYEINALKGLNFSKNPPKYILTEAHTQDRLDEIKKILSDKNYTLLDELGVNDYLFKIQE